MAKAHLLHAACAIALFATTPVFAQTTAPSTQTTPPAASAPATPSADATTSKGSSHAMHHSMGHMHAMHMSKTDTSQNAAVDQLNDQSYRAAQQGQSSSSGNAPSAGGTTAPAPSGSGKM